jgi:hypothetical protein
LSSSSGPPLRLHDVTICAIDCVNPRLAARALEKSQSLVDFGRAILFSDQVLEGDFESRTIEKIRSRIDYSRFVLERLNEHIETPFVLLVQWDGYVVDKTAWADRFLAYDYIGARWPFHADGLTVGNGGFSLRSKKLLQALASGRFSFDDRYGEDEFIGRALRGTLEREFAVVFAPEAVADQFSYERSLPRLPTFGFHGAFNLMRHEGSEAIGEMIDQLDERFFDNIEALELLLFYYSLCDFAMFMRVARRLLGRGGLPALRPRLTQLFPGQEASAEEVLRLIAVLIQRNYG